MAVDKRPTCQRIVLFGRRASAPKRRNWGRRPGKGFTCKFIQSTKLVLSSSCQMMTKRSSQTGSELAVPCCFPSCADGAAFASSSRESCNSRVEASRLRSRRVASAWRVWQARCWLAGARWTPYLPSARQVRRYHQLDPAGVMAVARRVRQLRLRLRSRRLTNEERRRWQLSCALYSDGLSALLCDKQQPWQAAATTSARGGSSHFSDRAATGPGQSGRAAPS